MFKQGDDTNTLISRDSKEIIFIVNMYKKIIFNLLCILRTLLLLITGCSEGCSKSPVHFFRRNRKLAPKLDRLQRRVIVSRWNLKIA